MPKARDLAGLAALGFLGYKLSQQGKGKGEDSTPTRAARPDSTETREDKDDDKGYKKDVLKAITATKEAPNYKADNQGVIPSGKSAAAKQATEAAPAAKDKATSSGDTSVAEAVKNPASTVSSSEKGMKNYVPRRKTTASSSAEGMKNYVPRRGLSPVDQIPGQDRSGPTGGERVSGTELSRNLSNTAAALTPLTGGASKVATEFALGNRAAKAATAEKLSPAGQRLKNMEEIRNVAMPGRRDAVMNPLAHAGGPKMMEKIAAQEGRAIEAEARAAAAQAAREAKTLNPNAWLAGPKGMAENFRKGGAVKMTASRRGDGIASRGKTRGKIC